VRNSSPTLGTPPHHADEFRVAMSIDIALAQRASSQGMFTLRRGHVPNNGEQFREVMLIDVVMGNASAWCGGVPRGGELFREARTSSQRCGTVSRGAEAFRKTMSARIGTVTQDSKNGRRIQVVSAT
jgi:hypothetical protein